MLHLVARLLSTIGMAAEARASSRRINPATEKPFETLNLHPKFEIEVALDSGSVVHIASEADALRMCLTAPRVPSHVRSL